MARIAVGGFHHETNTFVDTSTDFAYFCSHRDRPPLVRRGDVLKWLNGVSFALSGFLQIMTKDHDIVPLLWTSGGAGGMVTREAFERIAAEFVAELSQQMPVDAIYLDLHGAMVTEDFEDGEGELLRRIRACVGREMPIVISLDYHANVTPAMVDRVDAVCGYLTYPHVDRPETGIRAARAMQHVLKNGRTPGRALRKVPFLIPLHSQCTMVQPSLGIIERAQSLESADLLTVSYLAGFPPSDIFYCGPSVVVHGMTQVAADRAADDVARFIASREAEFAVPVLSPAEAVVRAKAITEGVTRPVIIADTQDNPGAGGSADTTGLLFALVEGGAEGAALGYLCDEQAVKAAHSAGKGANITLELGGRSGPQGVVPFRGTFEVKELGDGKIRTTGPVSGNRNVDLGPMALLQVGGVQIAVTTKRMQALDQTPFRHLGVEPKEQKILALKSTVHFRGDFQALAEDILIAIAPGAHLADSSKFPYKNLRSGLRLMPLGPESKQVHPYPTPEGTLGARPKTKAEEEALAVEWLLWMSSRPY
jgi:microcystin degradation protein MlrC